MSRISQLVFINLVLLLLNPNAWSLEQYSGQIQKNTADLSLVSNGTTYTIHAADSDILSSLEKFKTGDVISGLGDVQTDGSIMIQSIDYIGLKQLLGSWKADNDVYAVIPNFTELSLVASLLKSRGNSFSWSGAIKRFVYSVRPSAQTGFNLFLTDEHQTLLAEIRINNKVLNMKIYDPDTGQLQSSFRFTKL